MTDHRFRAIWFWEILVAGVLLALLFPDMLLWYLSGAMVPLGLFMPVIEAAAPCSSCNGGTQTDEIEITFTGIIDDNCSGCSTMNRTIILPFLGTCLYQTNVSISACGATTLTARFSWSSSIGGTNLFDYSINVPFDAQVAFWDPSFSTPRDCNSAADLSNIAPDGVTLGLGGTSHCNFTSCLATVVPTGSLL